MSNYKHVSVARTERVHKIDHVSRMVGLSQKRIRDYEKEGLIKPARDPNTNDRLFSEFDLKQIKKITYLIPRKRFHHLSIKTSIKSGTRLGSLSVSKRKSIARCLSIPINDAGRFEGR